MNKVNSKAMKNKSIDCNKDGRISWKELDIKDKIAYVMSVILIFSGIVMAFLSFFMTNDHNITSGALAYIGEAFVTGGALLGIGIWIKGKMGEINNYIHEKLDHDE